MTNSSLLLLLLLCQHDTLSPLPSLAISTTSSSPLLLLLPPPPIRHPITTSSADSGLCGYERDDEEEEIMTQVSFSLNRKKRVKKLLPSFPAEGKVKDSFAVVKESVDPYEDFKASMMEMILAKQLFEERDFKQLLEFFLSLNSRHHYEVIVDTFSDIWKTIFL
ncbi:transcription repressor OFP7-like [Camellia sinensis]|uniref:transcription repressor OFP7-like n=1 Tax=Camellia sinensis TaxID=4442 RepID=UPI001036BA35|nr:transcription repressor OFP7-like [Camellia sinensis]